MVITDTAMRAKPGERDIWLVQGLGRGRGSLCGRITPAGARTFYFRYTDSQGKQVRIKLGDYATTTGSGMTLAAARQKAAELSELYSGAGGAEPVRDLVTHLEAARAEAKAAELASLRAEEDARQAAALERARRLTVRMLFTRWAETDLRPHVRADGTRAGRKDAGEYTRQQFERHVYPTLGDAVIKEVRKGDLMAVLDKLKAEGKLRTANVLLSDLKQMFAFALARELIDRNPLDTITKRQAGGKETARDRVLSADEIGALPRLFEGANLNQRTALGVWVLLGTGARIGELMGSVWSGADLPALAASGMAEDVKLGVVDLEARTWHLPTTKNEREHTIHLSAFVVEQFQRLKALRVLDGDGKPSPWVFPNATASGPVCVKSFGKQLADRQRGERERMSGRSRNTTSLALPGGKWTAHDLRRTAASLMAGLGFSGDVIDECLNHMIESRVRRTYIRDRRVEDQKRAFDALGARLAALMNGTAEAGNVLEFKAA